jgi:hypothetical protein
MQLPPPPPMSAPQPSVFDALDILMAQQPPLSLLPPPMAPPPGFAAPAPAPPAHPRAPREYRPPGMSGVPSGAAAVPMQQPQLVTSPPPLWTPTPAQAPALPSYLPPLSSSGSGGAAAECDALRVELAALRGAHAAEAARLEARARAAEEDAAQLCVVVAYQRAELARLQGHNNAPA